MRRVEDQAPGPVPGPDAPTRPLGLHSSETGGERKSFVFARLEKGKSEETLDPFFIRHESNTFFRRKNVQF